MRAHTVSRAPEKHVTSVVVRHSANAIAPFSPILLLQRGFMVCGHRLPVQLWSCLCRVVRVKKCTTTPSNRHAFACRVFVCYLLRTRSCGLMWWHVTQCPVEEIRARRLRVSHSRLFLSRATTLHFDRTTRRSCLRSATLLLTTPTEKQLSPSRMATPRLSGS